jgi:hypothetical protein
MKAKNLNLTAALSPLADQQPIGLVKIVISGSFKITLGGSFHCNTQSIIVTT